MNSFGQNYVISTKKSGNHLKANIFSKKFNQHLLYSIIHSNILPFAFTDNSFQSLSFKCSSLSLFNINSLSFSTNIFPKIILDISTQIKFLFENYNSAFIGFNLNHILVVNNNTFIYLNGEHLYKLDQDLFFSVNYPPNSLHLFLAPEFYNIHELPFKVHYKCSFFSIGILFLYIFYAIENNNILNIDTNNYEQINNILSNMSFYNTKIFFFLERCLHFDPSQRFLLFI